MRDRAGADHSHRRLVAASDTRYALHADRALERCGEPFGEALATGHGAGQGVADPYRQPRCRLAVVHEVEVVVEARHFVDLALGQSEPVGQCGEVAGVQRPVAVMKAVQVFEKPVTAQLRLAEKGEEVGTASRVHQGGLPWDRFRRSGCVHVA